MRAILLPLLLCCAVAPALAAPPGGALAPIKISDLPQACRAGATRARAGNGAANRAQTLNARLSLAGCVADQRLLPLVLLDAPESVGLLEVAAAPAFALVDGVLAAGDPATQVMAYRVRAQLYDKLTVRLLDTVPAPTDTSPEAAVLRAYRRSIVLARITGWQERIRASHQAVVELAHAHPELSANPMIRAAISDSANQQGTPVASR